MNRVLILLMLCWLAGAVAASEPMLSGPALTAFRADLALLARELPARHAKLDHATPRADFDAAVTALDAALPTLTRSAATVALSRLVGLARDGHTALFLLPFPGLAPVPGMDPLPVQFYGFEDGWRIVGIRRDQRALLGAKLTAVGGLDIATLQPRIAALVPRDNAMGEREYVGHYLGLGAVLRSIDAATEGQPVRYTLVTDDGRIHTLDLQNVPGAPSAAWVSRLIDLPLPRNQWVAAGEAAAVPLWLRQPQRPYWFAQTAPDAVYAQVNLLREDTPGAFARFAEELVAALPAQGQLILDLRLNRGGNGDLRWALVHALLRAPPLQRPGRLFVLIGRRTFSAAQQLANALDLHTGAVFVGEPTGSSPNHYGELGQLQLPASGLTVLYSQLYWQHDPRDVRPWVAPDIAAPLTYADLANGRDPALAAVAAWQPPADPRTEMDTLLKNGDADGAVARFRAAAQSNPWSRPHEKALNDYGYALLGEERAEAALTVFELATALYPEAPNAWDSLGETHLARGDRARAAYCYGRTLRLTPDDAHARDMLARVLGAP